MADNKGCNIPARTLEVVYRDQGKITGKKIMMYPVFENSCWISRALGCSELDYRGFKNETSKNEALIDSH